MICKVLKKKISPFMSFGKMPIANGFIEKKDFKKEYFYNMEVGFSEDLSLFQLNDLFFIYIFFALVRQFHRLLVLH